MLKLAKIIVVGNVHGVFYRVWAKRQAEELGLTGYARNEPGGTVLIVVEGEEAELQELIDRCWDGPELAKVSDVQTQLSEYEGRYPSFTIQ